MQFGFTHGSGTADALFVVRRMQAEYKERKLFMCFVDVEKPFERSSKNGNGVANKEERLI